MIEEMVIPIRKVIGENTRVRKSWDQIPVLVKDVFCEISGKVYWHDLYII